MLGHFAPLEGVVDSFQKDMKSLQQTKWSSKIGAGLLTFCGAVAPLFMFYWWSIVVYYCLIACAVTSIFWGVLHCRKELLEEMPYDNFNIGTIT